MQSRSDFRIRDRKELLSWLVILRGSSVPTSSMVTQLCTEEWDPLIPFCAVGFVASFHSLGSMGPEASSLSIHLPSVRCLFCFFPAGYISRDAHSSRAIELWRFLKVSAGSRPSHSAYVKKGKVMLSSQSQVLHQAQDKASARIPGVRVTGRLC